MGITIFPPGFSCRHNLIGNSSGLYIINTNVHNNYEQNKPYIMIKNSQFSNNYGHCSGVFIWNNGANTYIKYCNFINNTNTGQGYGSIILFFGDNFSNNQINSKEIINYL